MKSTILIDDREKAGWYKILAANFNVIIKRLETGDYSIDGYEDIILIERKSGWEEIAQNLSSISEKKRFMKNLSRLSKVDYPMIVIEDSISRLNFAKFWSPYITPEYIWNWMFKVSVELRVPIFFIPRNPQKSAAMISSLFINLERFTKSKRFKGGSFQWKTEIMRNLKEEEEA